MKTQSWLKQPGECVDMHGIPIYPGDLLKTFHFTGPRRKKYYLYHVAVFDTAATAMRMMPASYLDPAIHRTGGDPLLSDGLAAGAEVIDGRGPDQFLSYDERPKRKPDEKGGA